MAIVLSLVSALMYGVSDFVGGRASRRVAPVAVALVAEVAMLPIALMVIPLVEDAGPPGSAVGWGIVAGLSGSVGVVGLYIALARGNMTVVAPVTGVVAAAVPVLTGIALGERPGPPAVVGIILAIAAVALIGGAAHLLATTRANLPVDVPTVALSVAVGATFGVLFVAFSRTGDDAGMWPLLFARFGGVPALAVAFAMARPEAGRRASALGALVPGLIVGLLVTTANASYLVATRAGLLSLVAVVVAMYPASTVALATVFDGERPSRSQRVGMVVAAIALVMITVS